MPGEWLKLSDPKLADDYNRPAFDSQKARAGFIATLEKAAEQFGKLPEKTKGRKIWSIGGSTVKLTLPFEVNGSTEHFIPSERFGDALKSIKADVTAGHHDSDLEASAGQSPGSGQDTSPRVRMTRRPMSEEAKAERRRKMEEKGTFGKGGRRKGS